MPHGTTGPDRSSKRRTPDADRAIAGTGHVPGQDGFAQGSVCLLGQAGCETPRCAAATVWRDHPAPMSITVAEARAKSRVEGRVIPTMAPACRRHTVRAGTELLAAAQRWRWQQPWGRVPTATRRRSGSQSIVATFDATRRPTKDRRETTTVTRTSFVRLSAVAVIVAVTLAGLALAPVRAGHIENLPLADFLAAQGNTDLWFPGEPALFAWTGRPPDYRECAGSTIPVLWTSGIPV
jgi:hypothetical protein